MKNTNLCIGEEAISIRQLYKTATDLDARVTLSSNKSFRLKLKKSRDILESMLKNGDDIYGVTTGYGDSCVVSIPQQLRHELALNLTRYHQCGHGDDFSIFESRAIVIARLISLSQGYSAIRIELLEFMIELFNMGIVPRIPQEGSVGASGDLTPLAYYAGTLVGEGDVFYEGNRYKSSKLYKKLGITPFIFHEKEALAIMNGTAVMTALSCLAFERCYMLAEQASVTSAMVGVGLLSNSCHFHPEIFKAKPHWGTKKAAGIIYRLMGSEAENKEKRIQDRYSVRCAPHIIGVLFDALKSFKDLIEIELNSANDNPLIDQEREIVLHGGNFYGGHIAYVMDSLKVQVAHMADLMDKQMGLLVDPKFNNGLPANLSQPKDIERRCINHGLKALQISVSAWTAECLKNSTSAGIFSRSTECHNQDKVSMGTIAARDTLRSLDLAQQVMGALEIGASQAISIRQKQGEITLDSLNSEIQTELKRILLSCPFIDEDRALEEDLRNVINGLNERVGTYEVFID